MEGIEVCNARMKGKSMFRSQRDTPLFFPLQAASLKSRGGKRSRLTTWCCATLIKWLRRKGGGLIYNTDCDQSVGEWVESQCPALALLGTNGSDHRT